MTYCTEGRMYSGYIFSSDFLVDLSWNLGFDIMLWCVLRNKIIIEKNYYYFWYKHFILNKFAGNQQRETEMTVILVQIFGFH